MARSAGAFSRKAKVGSDSRTPFERVAPSSATAISGSRDREAGRVHALAPAHRAARRPAEPLALPEDEAAVLTARRLDVEPLAAGAQRAGEVLQVAGHLLLRDPDGGRQLARGAGPPPQGVPERGADGGVGLGRRRGLP